jgi:S-adenosylmethionine hydrolase
MVHNAAAGCITLLTDFGLTDPYVGVMKGVIATIAPGRTLIDLSHMVPPQDIATGAWLLHISHAYFPEGTVHLCVVDPGVGSARLPIAIRTPRAAFVAPDNGLLSYVLASEPVLEAVALTNPAYQLPQQSTTFHGRDIFAPAAAYLATGVPLARLGQHLDPAQLERIPLYEPEPLTTGGLRAHVLHIDHFGNIITDIGPDQAIELLTKAAPPTVTINAVQITRRYRYYAEAPDDETPFLVADSSGHLAIAVRNGHAATLLGAKRGTPLDVIYGTSDVTS